MGLGCKLRDFFRVVKSAVSNTRFYTVSYVNNFRLGFFRWVFVVMSIFSFVLFIVHGLKIGIWFFVLGLFLYSS